MKLPEGWDIVKIKSRLFGGYTVLGVKVEQAQADPGMAGGGPPSFEEMMNGMKFELEAPVEDDFSPACFLPESNDEDEMSYCDICEQWCGPEHNHYGETIQEKDTSEWANSIHRVCNVCGHEDDIYPTGSGSYGSELDFCNKVDFDNAYVCESKWGMGQDHDRWAETYIEHDDEPEQVPLVCKVCFLHATDFDGTTMCIDEDDFHIWISIEELKADDSVTILDLQFVEKQGEE